MRTRLCWALMLSAMLLAGGCGVDDYSVVIKNVGERTINDASVSYGQFRSIGGIIIPKTWKSHGHPDHPIPAFATVEWRTDDGQMHRQDVEVKKRIPKGFRGDIQFEIGDDNSVTVQVIPREKLKL